LTSSIVLASIQKLFIDWVCETTFHRGNKTRALIGGWINIYSYIRVLADGFILLFSYEYSHSCFRNNYTLMCGSRIS
jgi:hypothetical protein